MAKDDIAASGDFVDYMIKDGQVAKIIASDDVMPGDLNEQAAKKAILHYYIMNKQDELALVDVEIDTGRFHQIRCQMAYHGMPLLGDVKYGSSAAIELSRNLGIRQTAICANRIAFKHPCSGKALAFQVTPENQAFAKFL